MERKSYRDPWECVVVEDLCMSLSSQVTESVSGRETSVSGKWVSKGSAEGRSVLGSKVYILNTVIIVCKCLIRKEGLSECGEVEDLTTDNSQVRMEYV